MKKYVLSSARIAIAAPVSNLGGGSYSSEISRHKYASPPPRKPKRVKRNMQDQFCTLSSCSERLEFHKDAHGWGSRPAINSGESRAQAPSKFVPEFVRKKQGKNAPITDLGQARNGKIVIPAGKLLSESRASNAIELLEAQKRARELAKAAKDKYAADRLKHCENGRKLALERNSLENAFKTYK